MLLRHTTFDECCVEKRVQHNIRLKTARMLSRKTGATQHSSYVEFGFGLMLSGFSLMLSGFGLMLSGFGLMLSGFGLMLSGLVLKRPF